MDEITIVAEEGEVSSDVVEETSAYDVMLLQGSVY